MTPHKFSGKTNSMQSNRSHEGINARSQRLAVIAVLSSDPVNICGYLLFVLQTYPPFRFSRMPLTRHPYAGIIREFPNWRIFRSYVRAAEIVNRIFSNMESKAQAPNATLSFEWAIYSTRHVVAKIISNIEI
jgi:hypothetical protein